MYTASCLCRDAEVEVIKAIRAIGPTDEQWDAAVAQPADILILELKAESLLPAQFQTFSASPPNRGFWAGSGLSAFEFTFGKIDIRGAISRCEALL